MLMVILYAWPIFWPLFSKVLGFALEVVEQRFVRRIPLPSYWFQWASSSYTYTAVRRLSPCAVQHDTGSVAGVGVEGCPGP